jgi:hypothetical protein
MTTNQAKRLRYGTKVRFEPNPVSLTLYSNGTPARGEEGVVTSLPFPDAKRKTFFPGPGGGLLYVSWENFGLLGVSPIDVKRA